MATRWANFASGQLASAAGARDTVIRVRTQDVGRFPTLGVGDDMYCVLYKADGSTSTPEIVRVTAVVGGAFTCVRGVGSTVAQAFDAGDRIENRVTAEVLNVIDEWRDTLKAPVLISLEDYEALTTTEPGRLYCSPEPDR